jgi:hypothetical protein
MAPRDRRSRRVQNGAIAQADSASVDMTAPNLPELTTEDCKDNDESGFPAQGISILKEIFPEHESPRNQGPLLTQLLGGIPSPARALGSQQTHGLVSTTPCVAPIVPPPPPVLPAAPCQMAQDGWDMLHLGTGALPVPEPAFSSYRERLRAGGRGALQRAFDAGLMPRTLKQETPCSTPLSHSSPMSYASAADGQMMWNTSDYWPAQMEHAQASGTYCPMQQMLPQGQDLGQMQHFQCHQQYVQPMPPQTPVEHLQLPHMQLPQPATQMGPLGQAPIAADGSPQMPQMQVQPMQMPQMQVPQMQVPIAANTDALPTELDRCMAIVMGQSAAQTQCDKDMLAAQLKATADCQCYED